jgi:D-alanyl-D-alanine carboxypeptidase
VFLRRLRSIALACALGVGSFVGVVQPLASPVVAASAPPACRYDDVLTADRTYTDWNITLLDTTYKLPKSYVPDDLVPTARAGLSGGGYVRSFAIPDLSAMAAAARGVGAGLRVVSAYRSYEYQVELFRQEVAKYGRWRALHRAARPGHSEHQLGTTIDFGSARTGSAPAAKFGNTAAGRWMTRNSWKFGWIMSYPYGETSSTCYASEPWHFRYVGREMAAKVHASGLTLREYLWRYYR